MYIKVAQKRKLNLVQLFCPYIAFHEKVIKVIKVIKGSKA